MEQKTIQVLLVEDSSFDAKLIGDLFGTDELSQFTLAHAANLTAAYPLLDKNHFDVILLDLTLPEAMGLDTFRAMYAFRPSVPIIALTRLDDEDIAVGAVDLGAQDYLVKGHVDASGLARAIRYGIERKHLLEELRRHLEQMEAMVKDRTSELIETIRRLKQEIDKRTRAEEQLQAAFDQLKDAQAQLIQAEKMETVGRLASGIAHEVKNPLAIILQGIEYLSKKAAAQDENIASIVVDMKEAVMRADGIIKGLLDFSGMSIFEKHTEELFPVIDKALLLLKHQFDKNHIEVVKEFGDVGPVALDKNRIEQVFINLFENATHAMPNGGRLTVKVFRYAAGPSEEGVGVRKVDVFRPGQEVVAVRIEDTGTGIPEASLSKVFDPFFTTKRSIGGTGLGLSIVHNIIDMHKGTIAITNKKKEAGTGVIVTLMFRQEPKGGKER